MPCKSGVLLDTNVFIFLMRNKEDSLKISICDKLIALKSNDVELYYNLTIFNEFSVGANTINEVKKHFSAIETTLKIENQKIMYDAAKSHRCYLNDFQELKKNTKELIVKSKTVPNDCIIGATARHYDLAIMTNNVKDFKKYFPDVEIIEI